MLLAYRLNENKACLNARICRLLSAYEPFNSKALVHVFAFPIFK